jgi:UDP-glucose 4-epimerase
MKTKTLLAHNTVLITGGAGFIGSHIVKKFLRSGAEVHIIDNLSTGKHSFSKNYNVWFHHGSILDKSFLQQLKEIKFDLILHLASVVGMKLATKYHDLVYDTATTGTLNILNIFQEIPVVLFSSSAVYGMDNKQPVKEDQKIPFEQLLKYDGGKKGYACGKWEMEQIGLNAASAGRKVLIIRPFNVIGPHQVSTYGMVVPTFIDRALSGESLTIYDDGFQIRSFSFINTFVSCLFNLMEVEDVWTMHKNIVNIGSRKGYSINDLALIVLKETHSTAPIRYQLYQDFFPNHTDVTYRVPDTSYGEKFYGNIKWPSLREIVKNILEFKLAKEEQSVLL